jgi:two-component system sensor kinase FixL
VNAGTLTENNLNETEPERPSVSGVVSAISAVVLVLTIAAGVWIYHQGAEAMNPANGFSTVHKINAGVALALAVALAVFTCWNYLSHIRERRLREELVRTQAALAHSDAETERSNEESRKLRQKLDAVSAGIESTIQERLNRMASAQEQLEKQLQERQKAERLMAQQAKELVRSKDVLELHVQNRSLEIQKLQQRYESMLNSAGEGIYGLDLQGRIQFVNPATAAITGWTLEELAGRSEREVFCHDSSRLAPESGDQDQSRTDCDIFYRRDGSTYPVEYTRSPITEGSREIGTVVVFKDITQRKRAEETLSRKAAELARSNAELEQFAYVASHDLQEPLRKIQAFGDRLKTKVDAVGLEDGRDYLDRMQGAAARMRTLIDDLLTFSRVISASQPFVPVDLNTVTKGVLSDLEVRIEQTRARVEVGTLPTIEADPLQLRQLLQNLIGNALKFQPPDAQPLIKIDGRILRNPFAGSPDEDPYAEQCELSVQDNGIGFDEKYTDKIFAVFQRLHGRTEFEGTGVGLAVCRRISDRHGGTIRAESRPGEGATFIVTLPVQHLKTQLAA